MIKVQCEDFNLTTEIAEMKKSRADLGAIVSFTGTVREGVGEQKITSMTLEHYPGMTERELVRIEGEARHRWDLIDCLIIHRYGKLLPGDNIVLVVTLSSHRKDAFQAAEFLMDYLKTSAPFWKKEIAAGDAHWVKAKQDDVQATQNWLKENKEEE